MYTENPHHQSRINTIQRSEQKNSVKASASKTQDRQLSCMATLFAIRPNACMPETSLDTEASANHTSGFCIISDKL